MLNTIQQAEARADAMRASWRGEVILSPKGRAYVAGLRYLDALAALPAQKLAAALALFTPELRVVIADLAAGHCGFEDVTDA